MDSLSPSLTLLLFLAAFALLLLVLRRVRVSELRRVKVSAEEAAALSAELMSYVKTKAYTIDTRVDSTPFWRKKGVSDADKLFVLAPHFQSALLLVWKAAEPWSAVLADRLTDWIFLPVERYVYLNPQEWTRMTAGKPGTYIHGDQYNDNRSFDQSIRGNAGPVTVGSISSGDDGFAAASNWTNMPGLTADNVQKLAGALRLDAGKLHSGQARPVHDLAEEVEQAAAQNSTNKFGDLVQKASGLAGLANGMLSATQSVVDLINPGS